MHVTHRKRFVSRDLVALAARRPQELAALSEAHYHDQIESIADEVLAAGQRIVMLTGPSAAGKTTSAHKIADAIAACGRKCLQAHSSVMPPFIWCARTLPLQCLTWSSRGFHAVI